MVKIEVKKNFTTFLRADLERNILLSLIHQALSRRVADIIRQVYTSLLPYKDRFLIINEMANEWLIV